MDIKVMKMNGKLIISYLCKMSKEAYIYFTTEELNKNFDLALVEIKKKVAIYKKKKKSGNLINKPTQVTLFSV